MDPNTLPKPQFELPRPQATPTKEALGSNAGEQDDVKADEKRNLELPAAAAPVDPSQLTAPAQDPVAAAFSGAGPADPLAVTAPITTTTPIPSDLLAEDSDLIEKAWVQKAKAIVEQTKADPHRQNNEINKVKKEYIQKRYHKDIKLSSE